jgi:hypothetical protein
MSLMEFGEAGPEPEPDGQPERPRRRYLILLGMVVVLILVGGSAAYFLLSSGPGGGRHASDPGPGPIADSASVDPTSTVAPSGSASASASPSASARRSATPSKDPSATTSVPPGAPVPVTYRLPSGDLCASMDTGPVEAVGGPGTKDGDHTDKSNYTDFTCLGSFGASGKVKMTADALVFATPEAAAASYAGDKTGTDHVTGVGTDATGAFPNSGGYLLVVVDGNLEFKVRLVGVGGQPNPQRLRQVAIDTAKNSLPKMR